MQLLAFIPPISISNRIDYAAFDAKDARQAATMFTPIQEGGKRHGVHAIGQAAPTEAAPGSFLNQFNMVLSFRHHQQKAIKGLP